MFSSSSLIGATTARPALLPMSGVAVRRGSGRHSHRNEPSMCYSNQESPKTVHWNSLETAHPFAGEYAVKLQLKAKCQNGLGAHDAIWIK